MENLELFFSLLNPEPQILEIEPDAIDIHTVSFKANGIPSRVNSLIQQIKTDLVHHNIELKANNSPNIYPIICEINSEVSEKSQSYELSISEIEIRISGKDESGLFYGLKTFQQILSSALKSGNRSLQIPKIKIEDYPDFYWRGVMLDVSRDKVPTMATLYRLIDFLSNWKINQFQLYMEHVFAYQGHECVWQNASPFKPEEIQLLDAYCHERFIELVPNQNSLGHFHRWLIHDKYKHLAECPGGVHHSFSLESEPFTLNPIDSNTILLLEELYTQLLPNFQSKYINVGLDEPFELGKGQSADMCREKGVGEVYLDYLKKIYSLVKSKDRFMQFWADIIFKYPEIVPKLPKDSIPLIWGYEADFPFDKFCEQLQKQGFDYYICPGTSSWNSLAGRTTNAIQNLTNAARAGYEYNASGYLITDWGDHGHLQPLPVSYPGFLVGSGLAWNSRSAFTLEKITKLLNKHIFGDKSEMMADLTLKLGNIYLNNSFNPPNNTTLFALFLFPHREITDVALQMTSLDELEKTKKGLKKFASLIESSCLNVTNDSIVKDEYIWIIDALSLSCDIGISRINIGVEKPVSLLETETKQQFIEKYYDLMERQKKIWLYRNREGGLKDSLRWIKQASKSFL